MSTILVIDDDDLVRDTLVRMLERAGFQAVSARNGREGLAQFHSHPPDLIVTDIIMPDFDGIETVMAFKRTAPAVPIIAVSGGGRTHTMQFLEAAQRLGADMILSKPFKQAELVSAITQLLARPKNKENTPR